MAEVFRILVGRFCLVLIERGLVPDFLTRLCVRGLTYYSLCQVFRNF